MYACGASINVINNYYNAVLSSIGRGRHTRRACARKCGPTGSMLRCVAEERVPIALKSFSAVQPSGNTGSGS